MPNETSLTRRDNSRSAAEPAPESATESTRARVLQRVRATSDALTVSELADELDLHANTIRFHIQALQESGLIAPEQQRTGTRGRPRVGYRVSARGARSGERNYRLLADVLVSDLAATAEHPRAAARDAGHSWGQRMLRERDTGAPLPQVAREVLSEMGFEPEARPAQAPEQLILHNCPFRELVDSHQQLVCSLHGGMVDALLAGAPGDQEALAPFVTPTTCAVRLR